MSQTENKTEGTEVQTPAIAAPEMDELQLPVGTEVAAPAPAATGDKVVGIVIPKFQRYEMLPDGTIRNRATEQIMEVKEDPKEAGVMQCRLTDDEGKRKYIKTAAMFTKLYNPDIEGKTAKVDKPEKGIKLSKSMKIYLLNKAGIGVAQICETPTGDAEDPIFVANHVRSSIKDYSSASNQAKRDKAERIAAELEKLGTPFVIPAVRVEEPKAVAPAPEAAIAEAAPVAEEAAPATDAPVVEAE